MHNITASIYPVPHSLVIEVGKLFFSFIFLINFSFFFFRLQRSQVLANLSALICVYEEMVWNFFLSLSSTDEKNHTKFFFLLFQFGVFRNFWKKIFTLRIKTYVSKYVVFILQHSRFSFSYRLRMKIIFFCGSKREWERKIKENGKFSSNQL